MPYRGCILIPLQAVGQSVGRSTIRVPRLWEVSLQKDNGEVEGLDNAPVKVRHLSIGITAMTVIKLIITNSVNPIHTKK